MGANKVTLTVIN